MILISPVQRPVIFMAASGGRSPTISIFYTASKFCCSPCRIADRRGTEILLETVEPRHKYVCPI